MSTPTGPILIDRLDTPNPPPASSDPTAYRTGVKRRSTAPWRAYVALGGLGLLVGGCALAALWQYVSGLYARSAAFATAADGTALALVLLGGLSCVGLLGAGLRAAWSASGRAAIVRLPGDVPATLHQVERLDVGGAMARHFEVQAIGMSASQMRNVTTLTLTNSQPPSPSAPAALPAGEGRSVQLLRADEWLGWIDSQPHALIAGQSGSGKTTLTQALISERLARGESLYVADPKRRPGRWFDAPGVGDGRDIAAILAALAGVDRELADRYVAFSAGQNDFPRLTILVDEAPDIVAWAKAHKDKRWERFASGLGSLAREVGLSVVLLSQSCDPDDLGINPSMRRNYARVALGEEVWQLLRQERHDRRRAELRELLQQQSYPAAIWRSGQVEALDTTDIVQRAARRVAPGRWTPPPADDADPLVDALREAVDAGATRASARASGLRFDNDLWAQIAAQQTDRP